MKIFRLKILLIITLILHITILSCKKKNENFKISGTAINSQLNAPVSNIKVVLYLKQVTSGSYNNQYTTFGTTYTQADGSFSFEFKDIKATDFKIAFSKTGYFTDEYNINPDLLQQGENYNQTYYVHQEGWVKLLIKNNYPYSVADILTYKFTKGITNCEYGCNDTLKSFYGANVDTISICKIWGSQWAVIEWDIYNSTSHLQYKDSLWISPSDTIVKNLYY